MRNRPPYSRRIGMSDEFDVEDVPEGTVERVIKNRVVVWECDEGHINFAVPRDGYNDSVACDECTESYTL